ncbi:NTE family protein [Capnocytophaga haemolytica]|jgi:phospholipase, patatin family|uniref:NTE family protein rssA n=1 Tax=Capnocytophaga haemolytica TaxID=45243 RepID=A0AAX2GZJ1_9FLAO|nr:patatin-like phospholipase family protein [Capnocytophaga haemolytica]AMD84182.1 phospholipase [Capnocytophaga haemolytica]SFN93702.1 NTE family protein [Capnocytophaga haemolytica]SNV12833.1 NTE family protein rssA [Capnocytophaga haemolytica]
MKQLGLVFSGGGIRALAHAGLLKALEEEGIAPAVIAATSGGALVGGLYASGIKAEAMFDFFTQTPLFKFSHFTFKKVGLLDSAKYPKLFKKYIPQQTFEELETPLWVATTNLLSGKVQYFGKGELIRPLVASAALPPYFSPVKIGDGLYCDGGVLDNFPIDALKGQCEVVIGSFINPLKTVTEAHLGSTLKYLQRIYDIMLDGHYARKFKKCDLLFLHQLDNIGVLDVKELEAAFTYGYQQTKARMGEIIALLQA